MKINVYVCTPKTTEGQLDLVIANAHANAEQGEEGNPEHGGAGMSTVGPDPAKAFANDPMFKHRRRHRLDLGQCPYCDREREAGNGFHPSHDASQNCQSGKRAHCSCDTCF